jgi:hypothetical protein
MASAWKTFIGAHITLEQQERVDDQVSKEQALEGEQERHLPTNPSPLSDKN